MALAHFVDRLQRRETYSMAAVGYAIYGTIYLIGAILELSPARKVTSLGFIPWWSWYVGGAALIAAMPVFLARGVRWLAILLALGTGSKCLFLVWQHSRRLVNGQPLDLYNVFFAAVALGACILLIRAASSRFTPSTAVPSS